ncbi:hypothetical protein HOLleu_04147 [Holothuria leucospilota]|uniref:Immunoglobulin domain-containing protein n=1 Tax=Holothuria leucospilota TaxID=206669 RepID=A0A9Q1CSW2_HOLLE|nr:hypothetical protein HOLleu_04147 [Holothuria leucospilota]
MFQILLTIVVCQFRIIPAEATDSEGSMCPSVVYLKVGSEGQIPCTCGTFTIVAWYWKEEYDNRGSPIINYDKVQKTGSGYSSGEYDIAENGSLIISSVMRHHEGNFVVTVADDFQHREDTIFIKVIVVVPAAPPYPVVNDKVNQQHVYMDVNRNGTLRCAMFGVYPDVNLTFTSESDKIIFQHDSVLKTPLQNNTFDVTFNMHYIVTDLTLKRLTIFCKVADDNIAEQFPDKTKVDLLFLPVYPVVNGYVYQNHVYLDANREGQLNCLKEKVEAGTSLAWEVVGSSWEGKVSIESAPPDISSNYDGTSNINQIINYTADYSVDRIHLLCKVIQRDTENVFATKVDLLFESVYPVVNGCVNQKHVFLDVDRKGHLTCLKEKVDTDTTLVWKIVDRSMHEKITFQSSAVISKNDDGSVNINQTFDFEVHDHSLERITIECIVEPDTGEHAVATRVDLLFQSVYPLVNGHVSQKHVYLDVDREGHLTCIKENVDAGTTLSWKIVDTSIQEQITFQSREIVLNNNDGTVTINQTFDYEINDHTVDRITIECAVVTPDTDDIPLATKVDLLLQNVYPVVNGHVNQGHVYLDVERVGHLSCVKKNADAEYTLYWVVDPTLHGKIMFESSVVISNNSDGTVNINRIFDYEVRDHSMDRITIECKIMERNTDEHLLATRVDLLFQNVYPMVNGHVNQNHVYLDVERMGHLSCVKENVIAGTRLDWVLDSDLRGKVVFESRTVTLINSDGTVNINQTFDYDILDNSLDRITLECRVIEPESVEHPFTTTVELLFSSVLPPFSDPVISGCYHQPNDCILQVGRSGELTCTVKNSHYPVDLKWSTLDGDKEYLVFGKTRVKSHNSTNLYDVSITTPYTVVDKSVTSVTVQCDAWRSDSSGQILAVAKTSLKMTDGNTNISILIAVLASSLLTVFLVVALGLFVFILWYKNRKMHKKFAEKFLEPLLDRHTQCGNCSPEYTPLAADSAFRERSSFVQMGTIGINPYRTANGGPVRCSSEVCDAGRQEVQDINESLESPDSGNSGSNSRELSGSEASEKYGLMDDIEMPHNYSKQDPLLVNKEGFEDTPMV